MTVASSTVSPDSIARIAFALPAPPTMKNSSRPAASIAASTPTPWSSSWFHSASICGAAESSCEVTASPPWMVKSAATRLLTSRPQSSSASAKPRERSCVSGSESMPATSATTASSWPSRRSQMYVPADTPMP